MQVLNFHMARYLPSSLRHSLIASGFNANDLTREFVIPMAVMSAVTAGASNVAAAMASLELARNGSAVAEAACISVDKPTLLSPEETQTHCIESGEETTMLMESAMSIHSKLSQTLVEACDLEAVTVNAKTNRVRAMETTLKSAHFIHHPDNNWTVTVDGFSKFDEDKELNGETFEAGAYTFFFQPNQAGSIECAKQAASYIEAALYDSYDPMKVACRVHVDEFATYNGNDQGALNGVVMPVVSCGTLGISNPRGIQGADKEDGHYSHINTISL